MSLFTDDVEAAIAFYTEHLAFGVEFNPAPGFALLSRGDLRLLLNEPGAGGAGRDGLRAVGLDLKIAVPGP